MVKCGAQPVFYQYPAWTFGGKRSSEPSPDGPGTGGFAPSTTLGRQGFVYGPRSASVPRSAEPYGDGYRGSSQLKAPDAPAYSFGKRLPEGPNKNPGPDAYNTFDNAIRNAPTSSWGPPPRRIRPATSPYPVTVEDRPPAKVKGPSFGLAHRNKIEETPGPQDYQCGCGGSCCKYCDSYNGVTIRGRLPLLYGKVTTKTPGPAAYHTECSTIGVATAACASGPPPKPRAKTHRH